MASRTRDVICLAGRIGDLASPGGRCAPRSFRGSRPKVVGGL